VERLALQRSWRSPDGEDTLGCERTRKSPPQQETAARQPERKGSSGWMPMRQAARWGSCGAPPFQWTCENCGPATTCPPSTRGVRRLRCGAAE